MDAFVYLDHASTTSIHPKVLEAMWPYLTEAYGNPSSPYPLGKQAKQALDWAHEAVAEVLGARPSEIVFTSSGSESDNLAIKGVAWANRRRGNHIITTQVEHHAVLHACQYLEHQHGFRVTYLPVDHYGLVDLEALERALDDETVLVSVMAANNEVGTILPIKEIGRLLRPRRIPFHTDAVQAAGVVELDVDDLGVDLLSLSAHKFYGPKGVGALYVRRGTALHSLIHGGLQERERRAGTENVAGIVGLAAALQLAQEQRESNNQRLARLRDKLIEGVLGTVEGALLTGHPTERLPNSASFCFEGVQGETVLLGLEMKGVYCSSSSACMAGSQEPSHVLLAMGYAPELAHTAVRMTLGTSTTEEEIDYVLGVMPQIMAEIEGMALQLGSG